MTVPGCLLIVSIVWKPIALIGPNTFSGWHCSLTCVLHAMFYQNVRLRRLRCRSLGIVAGGVAALYCAVADSDRWANMADTDAANDVRY